MKLGYDTKSKNPTYYIQEGFRNGKKTSTRNVKRIGRHSELLAITNDPIAYSKEEVRKYNETNRTGKMNMDIQINFDKKLIPADNIKSRSTILNVGYFILQKIYQELNLSDFFTEIKKDKKVTFPCNDINRFLTFSRILEPQSKYGTFDNLNIYYEQPSFEYQHMLRFMDILENNYDKYLEHLYANSTNVVPRDTSICYYDCSNYYFEIGEEDEDFVDEVTGEVMRGLRKYGPSKDHKPNPLAQMGLFMDGSGIPLTMCINPGSDNEQKSAIPLEKKLTKMFKGKPFIYCADAGLGSSSIRKYNSMGGRAFVVTQSVKKLSQKLQDAVFDDFEYRRLSDNSPATIEYMKEFDRFEEKNLHLYNDVVYKVLDIEDLVDVGLYEEKVFQNGNSKMVKSKATMKQRVIITFSRKSMEYQRHIRNSQIERAQNIINNKNVEDVKKGPHDVTRFIKRTSVGKNGEKASDHYGLDKSVIDREEKYDGYYALATNLDDDVKTIIDINSKRYKIEDCFRVLKTNFRSRPVYHRNYNRIVAHFMICYTALLIYRLLEKKLEIYGSHFTIRNIIETLKNMNIANVKNMYYMSTYTGGEVCTALNGIYNLGLDKEHYRPKELNKKIKEILK